MNYHDIAPFTLSSPVVYTGRDYFGRNSSLTLEGGRKDGNWTWNGLHIDQSLAGCDTRRITLAEGKDRLTVYEHIGALRFGGLAGVRLTGDPWPPYHARGHELWQLVKAKKQEDTRYDCTFYGLYGVHRPVRWTYPSNRGPGGKPAFTEILPAMEPVLKIEVVIDYKGLGRYENTFTLPDPALFDRLCLARAQGWPSSYRKITSVARLLGWPHQDKVCWPGSDTNEKIIEEFALHRVFDLLGGLSLLCRDGFFVGHVRSHYAGHLSDVMAVKMAARQLVLVDC